MNCTRSPSELPVEPAPFLNIVFKSPVDVFLSSIYLLPFPSPSPPVVHLNHTSVGLVLLDEAFKQL